jgi:hypothetical protein
MNLEDRVRAEWEKQSVELPGRKGFALFDAGHQYGFGLELLNGDRFSAKIPTEWFYMMGPEVTDDRITSGIRMALDGLTSQIARKRIKQGAAHSE